MIRCEVLSKILTSLMNSIINLHRAVDGAPSEIPILIAFDPSQGPLVGVGVALPRINVLLHALLVKASHSINLVGFGPAV